MPALAFYGDSEGSEVFAIDISSMSLLRRIPTGSGPYPVDAVGKTHVLASTRKEASVTPIGIASLVALPKVPLSHKPRSSSTHENGLILVSGADTPLTTVIDSKTWKVIGKPYGEPVSGKVDDFGGQLASGHERWLPDGDRFFLLDRLRRRVSLYRHSTSELLWSINTPTSCHHVLPDPEGSGAYFAMCEGNPFAKTPPSVMKFAPSSDIFTVETHQFLPIESGLLPICGGHHVDISGDYLYCGSNEGFTYVLRKDTLVPVTRIPTGSGNGHTGFILESGQALGITINHTAQFITIFDLITHTPIRSVHVSNSSATPIFKTQGHTSGKFARNFYMMASLDSVFLEIDTVTGTVTRRLTIPPRDTESPRPFPMQGVFIWDAPGVHCTQCC